VEHEILARSWMSERAWVVTLVPENDIRTRVWACSWFWCRSS
jgi:hypothetical protein